MVMFKSEKSLQIREALVVEEFQSNDYLGCLPMKRCNSTESQDIRVDRINSTNTTNFRSIQFDRHESSI